MMLSSLLGVEVEDKGVLGVGGSDRGIRNFNGDELVRRSFKFRGFAGEAMTC